MLNIDTTQWSGSQGIKGCRGVRIGYIRAYSVPSDLCSDRKSFRAYLTLVWVWLSGVLWVKLKSVQNLPLQVCSCTTIVDSQSEKAEKILDLWSNSGTDADSSTNSPCILIWRFSKWPRGLISVRLGVSNVHKICSIERLSAQLQWSNLLDCRWTWVIVSLLLELTARSTVFNITKVWGCSTRVIDS